MECYHKIQLKSGDIVPCGKCPACLANSRREWIFRLQQEFLASNFAIFVTLTYDNEHIPLDFSVNKRDVQLFLKRLRKHFPAGDLRYYIVSEYGDHTFRPHYHGLLFFNGIYEKKSVYDIIETSWKNGFCSFGDVEEGSIVYCTKYCLKHSSTPEGCAPTFRLVSKMNGGIGSYYLEKMSSYHEETQNNTFVVHNGVISRMPRYYKSKLAINKDKWQVMADNQNRQLKAFNMRFNDFVSKVNVDNYDDIYMSFNEHELERISRMEDAVFKHCKKQKF